jgi:rhodanese-related sulfurtransferase
LIRNRKGDVDLKFLVFQKQCSFLILAALFLGVIVFYPINSVCGKPYTNIDVATANDMISDASNSSLIVLDVRTRSEYDAGHLENAVLIPVTELESRIDEIAQYRDTEIIVYCKGGARSTQASSILDSNNFTKVFNVLGGITAWESANYPVIHEFPSWIILAAFLVAISSVTATAIVIIHRKNTKKPNEDYSRMA